MISLFAVVDAYGQVNCPTCPKGLTAPSSISSPQQFNGYTSEVDHFDGTTPTCYTPTAATLNGHLRGINNALCAHRTRIDSLIGSDTSLINRIDSIISILDSISADLESNYNTSIISSDSSVNIVASMVGLVQQFNLSVDIDSVKSKLVSGLDISCLGVPRNFDSIMNKLIEIACTTNVMDADTCTEWELYMGTLSIGSTDENTTVSISSNSFGAVPSGMCLTKIEYIYEVSDSVGNTLVSGLVNGNNILGTITNFAIPIGYVQGARFIGITARYWKEKCVSHKYCGILDVPSMTVIPVFTLSPLIANTDNYSTTVGTPQSFNLLTNDVTPYTVSSTLLIRGASKGTASLISGILSYTASTSGLDSLRYSVTDIYGRKDTAYIIITNASVTAPTITVSGSIDICNQSGTALRIFNSLVFSNKGFGAVKLIGVGFENDTAYATSITDPLVPNFPSMITVGTGSNTVFGYNYRFNNLNITDINSSGGTVTMTASLNDSFGSPKLVDIIIYIPSGISSFSCGSGNFNASYSINVYDPL